MSRNYLWQKCPQKHWLKMMTERKHELRTTVVCKAIFWGEQTLLRTNPKLNDPIFRQNLVYFTNLMHEKYWIHDQTIDLSCPLVRTPAVRVVCQEHRPLRFNPIKDKFEIRN